MVCDWFGPADLTANFADASGKIQKPRDSVKLLLGGAPDKKPKLARLASPIFHITPDDPPFLIMHGQLDRVVPIDQSRKFYRALKKAKVDCQLEEIKGAAHGFLKNVDLEDIHKKITEFFDKHLKPPPEKISK